MLASPQQPELLSTYGRPLSFTVPVADRLTTMPKAAAPPPHTHLNRFMVATHFLVDSWDFQWRFFLLSPEIAGQEASFRLKCFVDLRMAYECALKSAMAFYLPVDYDRGEVVNQVVKCGQNIQELFDSLDSDVVTRLGLQKRWNRDLAALPVDLRYALDTIDFVYHPKVAYVYPTTVGSDTWLLEFRDYANVVIRSVAEVLREYVVSHGWHADPADFANSAFNRYHRLAWKLKLL